ncbi:hypothetical protein CPT_MyoSmar_022 [Serratia phage MyoSmar]|uniref:Uncharacterized protein n=1 Tax=Serratia phage MyoSmar TaxID=2596673 RepID=A0A5B9NDI6_9CAUD|nr:hypothetical protein HWC56_gp022 [Serratia phage MyoSmar]QEG09471.1 hypothetical protein CPT_MyoSmar_022 [Serratia phage MyoSmar]
MSHDWLTQRAMLMTRVSELGEDTYNFATRIQIIKNQAKRSGVEVDEARISEITSLLEAAREEKARVWSQVQAGDLVEAARKQELDFCRRISEARKITVVPGNALELSASELMTLAAALTAFMKDIEVLNADDSRDMYNAHRRNIESLINKFEDYANERGL